LALALARLGTTGLHFDDVAQLFDVLHELVDQGNTMVVIEHNLKVQNSADWVVDMRPEGGGDEVVAEGAPEQIARTPRAIPASI
jgi:excinuclease ABC subunit A